MHKNLHKNQKNNNYQHDSDDDTIINNQNKSENKTRKKLCNSIRNNKNLPVATILEQSDIGDAVVETPKHIIVGEDYNLNCAVYTIVNNSLIQNDDIQNPTQPSLLETYD